MPANTAPTAAASAEDVPRRFGLPLARGDFDQLREEFDRINEVERTAELAATSLRLF